MPDDKRDRSVRAYARLAGFLYLFILAVFYAADYLIVSRTIVEGDFTQSARNVLASEPLYRLGLAGEFAASWLTIPLAGALYVVLKRVDPDLALFALLFRVAEAVLGSVCALIGFVAVRIYTGTAGAFGPAESQALVQLLARAYGACFTITVIFFSIGSLLFFVLLFRSRFLPRILSGFGVLASLLVTVLGFANLIVPQYATLLAPAFMPILVAEVATGLWLLLAAVNTTKWNATAGVAD
ncbi:MAG: DUF4386 domain-containing protein [Rhizomicrobium sp.]